MFEPSDLNQPQPDMSQAEEYLCDRCEHPFFKTIFMVKRLSPLLSPTGETILMKQGVFKCDDCGWINRSQFGMEE